MSEKEPLNNAVVCRNLKRGLKCYCVTAEHRIKNDKLTTNHRVQYD